MASKTSPFLEANYGWPYGFNGWSTGMDENLVKFSFMFDGNVNSIVSTLPAITNGNAHFLTTDNRFYFAVNNTWYSSPCPKSFIFKIRSSGDFYQFNGTTASKILNPTEVQTRITDIEASLVTLDSFATKAELDVASAQANAYTDLAATEAADYADSVLVQANQYTDALETEFANTTGATKVGYSGGTVSDSLTALEAFADGEEVPLVTAVQLNGQGLELTTPSSQLIIRSPDNTRYRIVVDDTGVLTAVAV